jgi:hypothetical protein
VKLNHPEPQVAHVTTTRSALGLEETRRWLEQGRTLVVRRTFVPTGGDGEAVSLTSCTEKFVTDANPPSFAAAAAAPAPAKAQPAQKVEKAPAAPPPPAAATKEKSVKATGAPVPQYERVPGQDYEFVTMRNEKGFLEVRAAIDPSFPLEVAGAERRDFYSPRAPIPHWYRHHNHSRSQRPALLAPISLIHSTTPRKSLLSCRRVAFGRGGTCPSQPARASQPPPHRHR